MFTTWSKKAKLGPHLIINNSATPVMSKVPWCHLRLYAQFWRTCRKYQRKLQKRNNILNKLLAVTAVIRADALIMKQPVVNSFRPMRPTLNDTFKNRVKQHTNNREQLSLEEYKNALKSIHRNTVHTQFNKHNKPLGTQTLPRIARIRLAQLELDTAPF